VLDNLRGFLYGLFFFWRFNSDGNDYKFYSKLRYKFRLIWLIRQLFPLTYWCEYSSFLTERGKSQASGSKHFAIWKMWFGKCYRITDVKVKD
jgi:hypothetical protein